MGTIFIDVYGLVPFLDEDLVPEMNSILRITYGTLHRFACAVTVSWIIFACVNGYGDLKQIG